MDALDFLDQCKAFPKRSLLFIDPPYYRKGPGLYTSFYKAEDHGILAERVLQIETPWVVTYDDVPQIGELYSARRQFCFDIRYSLNKKRTGNELLIASEGLRIPTGLEERSLNIVERRAA